MTSRARSHPIGSSSSANSSDKLSSNGGREIENGEIMHRNGLVLGGPPRHGNHAVTQHQLQRRQPSAAGNASVVIDSTFCQNNKVSCSCVKLKFCALKMTSERRAGCCRRGKSAETAAVPGSRFRYGRRPASVRSGKKLILTKKNLEINN